jgi:hypothetical protein
MKQQLIKDIAIQLTSYGYTVYLSDDGRHGFYTDGTRCVSFGGSWSFCVDFSGNYLSNKSGTGWSIAKEKVSISEDEARKYIQSNAPLWATREQVIYTTPEQHLKTYGRSSGYAQFKNDEVQA